MKILKLYRSQKIQVFVILFLFLIIPVMLHAQSGIRIGYGIAFTNPKDINRVIYIYNLKGGFDKEMPYIWNVNGLTLAYYKALADDGYWEVKWQNRHSNLSARKDISGVMMQRDLKFRQNFISGGLCFGKPFYGGLGIELGNQKGFTRVDEAKNIKAADYEKIYPLKKGYLISMQGAMSLYGGFEKDYFGIRFCYQWQFIKKATDDLDNELLGGDIEASNSLEQKFNNFGIEMYVKIGR